MGAGFWVAEECADLVGRFGRQDVFELAGLLLDFGFAVHGEAVGEKPLCQTMPSNDASRTFASARRQLDDHRPVAYRG